MNIAKSLIAGIIFMALPSLGAPCTKVLPAEVPAEAAWRSANTVGVMAPTSPAREARIKRIKKMFEAELFAERDPDTPYMLVVPREGVKDTIIDPPVYQSQVTPRNRLTGVKGDNLQVTMVLPVSGHRGHALARQWAKERVPL